MSHTGQVSKINQELEYGFIAVPNLGNVFFSKETIYTDFTFQQLEIGMKVTVSAAETERGLFAESLSSNISQTEKMTRRAEASL